MSRTACSRIVALAAASGLLLAACGGDDGSATSGDTPDKLVVWTYFTGGQLEALGEQNALWEERYPDIHIEHVQIPFDQLAPRLLASAATQDGPDVLLDNVVVDFPTLVSGGVLADLSEYWDGYEDRDLFPDSAVWSTDGGIYNLMSYTNLLAVYYNQDILDEYGIAPPATVEEFEEAMEAIAADGTYVPLSMQGDSTVGGAWMFMPLLLSRGVNYCNFEAEAVEDELSRLESWSQAGYLPRESATWGSSDAWQQFLGGNYAFAISGNWNISTAREADFEVGVARYPAGPDGSRVFPGGEGIGIGAFTDHPDLAWEYVQLAWLSPEASMINFELSGQIPIRADLADDPAVTGDALAAPFVEAAGETRPWPLNEETAAMQEAVGTASSAVISGQRSSAEAAAAAVSSVEAALEQGGGSC